MHRHVLRWYRMHGRHLPWRDNNNAYHVLVSEFMLQQTQVSRVIDAFHAWCTRFPAPADLARASRREVLLAWQGLGYNRRAMHLHETAKRLVSQHDGRIPCEIDVLQRLPGIGSYTARAIACFGLRIRTAVVDVNVQRIFVRILGIEGKPSAGELQSIADHLLPPRAWYNWNQALMDLGALVCTAVAPRCVSCPVRHECATAGTHVRGRSSETTAGVVREPPRRYFRGRIIELLRGATGHQLTLATIGHSMKPDYSKADQPWLLDIVASLCKDGMITQRIVPPIAQRRSRNHDEPCIVIELAE